MKWPGNNGPIFLIEYSLYKQLLMLLIASCSNSNKVPFELKLELLVVGDIVNVKYFPIFSEA